MVKPNFLTSDSICLSTPKRQMIAERQEHRAVAETQARGSRGTQRFAPSLRNGSVHAAEQHCDGAPCASGNEALMASKPETLIPSLTKLQRSKRDMWSRTTSWSLTMPGCAPTQKYTHAGLEASASTPGSPAQGRVIRAGARGWIWCTAVVHGGGWGRAGQVHCTPQHQVTHMTHRVQHLRREQWGYTFKQVPTSL